jgi:hypothetical protein
MRCEHCSRVTAADLRYRGLVFQQPSFPALKNSAESGCDLCSLSYTAIVTSYHDPEFLETLCRGQNPRSPNDHDTSVHLDGFLYDYYELSKLECDSNHVVVRVGIPTYEISAILKFGVGPGRCRNHVGWPTWLKRRLGSSPERYIAGKVPSQNPGCPISTSRIQSWVQHCDETHKTCASISAPHPLPTRVLDIKDKPIVRHTYGAKGRYVALSYCWGRSGKNLLLTRGPSIFSKRSTYDEFTTVGIEIDTLARTVQDAIVVCRNLNIDYLWVDALCIIQEEQNLDDFKAEAPQMSDYYRNAYLTLVIGSARDCTDGFLNERSKPKAAPCEIIYTRTDLLPDRAGPGVLILFMPVSRAHGHTLDRAWTYQESMLSQRSLVFGLEQFHYTCRARSVFEDGHFEDLSSLERQFSKGHLHVHDLVRHNNSTEKTDYAYKLWNRGILNYTARSMSNPLDKFAAIAGFAKLLQNVLQCRYLYGLWENDLVRGLSWTTRRPWLAEKPRLSKSTRSRLWELDRVPSWSWASVDGVVAMPLNPNDLELFRDIENLRLKILAYDNVPRSFDPVRGDAVVPEAFELTLRGHLKRLWHVPIILWKTNSVPIGFMLFDYQISFDVEGFIEVIKEEDLQNNLKRDYLALGSWDTYDDYESRTYWGRHIYTLLLTFRTGLLLTHSDGKYYRRIGHFSTTKGPMLMNTHPEDITLI